MNSSVTTSGCASHHWPSSFYDLKFGILGLAVILFSSIDLALRRMHWMGGDEAGPLRSVTTKVSSRPLFVSPKVRNPGLGRHTFLLDRSRAASDALDGKSMTANTRIPN